MRESPTSWRAITALFIAFPLTVSCSPDPNYLHVAQAKPSPDGALRAVYVEDTQGGAAVGTGQDVYVLKISDRFQYSDRVFSNECVQNVSIDWTGPRSLKISFDTGSENMAHDGADAKPWWSLNRSPSHGIKLQLAPRVHPGNFC